MAQNGKGVSNSTNGTAFDLATRYVFAQVLQDSPFACKQQSSQCLSILSAAQAV